MQRLLSLVLVLSASWVQAADPPAVRWPASPPAVKIGCDCPRTGVCVCIPYCGCGVEGYTAVWAKARTEGKPFVIFAGTPRRDVPGACTIGFEKWCSETECFTRNVVVCRADANGLNSFTYKALPATATDQQIAEAWRGMATAVRKQPLALRPGEHTHVCSRCGYEWAHSASSYGNLAAHTCARCGAVQWQPSRYGPSAGSYRLSALPSFGVACPT